MSTAGLAAQNLGAATGVQVRTAASLVNAIEHDTAPAVDVLIWDEMGMASNREQGVILAWAASNQIDVRGMG
ncbi:AAA family ATPase, partial [Streptobacillus moniliformis]|uniref:AAA family ATPase n=1 Tax=Streptobacillus moniliformis TaxID=34105 RepID=UPI0034DD6428